MQRYSTVWKWHSPDELYHHGIKGMKWGIRRTPAQLGHKPYTDKPERATIQKTEHIFIQYERKMNNGFAKL